MGWGAHQKRPFVKQATSVKPVLGRAAFHVVMMRCTAPYDTSLDLLAAFVVGSFGDQNRAYLRGQLTVHKTIDKVNRVWRRCRHLSYFLERIEVSKVVSRPAPVPA